MKRFAILLIFLVIILLPLKAAFAQPPEPPPVPGMPSVEDESTSIPTEALPVPTPVSVEGDQEIIGKKIKGSHTIKTTIPMVSLVIEMPKEIASESGLRNVKFREEDAPILEFDFDFNKSLLNLSKISIEKQSNAVLGYTIVSGVDLEENATKTVYLDKINTALNGICIKDAEINSTRDISSSCNSGNEYKVECDGTLQHGYSCSFIGNISKYKVSGLRNSGIMQFDFEKDSGAAAASSGSEGGGSSSNGGGGSSGGGGSRSFSTNNRTPAASAGSGTQDSQQTAADDVQSPAANPASQAAAAQQAQPEAKKSDDASNAMEVPKEEKGIFPWISIFFGFLLAASLLAFLLFRHGKKQAIADDQFQNPYPMIDPDVSRLKNYISSCLDRGYRPESIRQALLKNDWPVQKIDRAFNELGKW